MDLNDFTGLGKLADSKVAQRVYEDGISPAMQQVGLIAEDTAKLLRLIAAPIQLAAAYQDRLAMWLNEIRRRVPVERQIPAPANVAGPVLLALRFEEDSSAIADMFLNLMTAAIDRDRQADAHPAYARIIEQLSPWDTWVLHRLSQSGGVQIKDVKEPNGPARSVIDVAGMSDLDRFSAASLQSSIDHLQGLGLLKLISVAHGAFLRNRGGSVQTESTLQLNRFAEGFLSVCLSEALVQRLQTAYTQNSA